MVLRNLVRNVMKCSNLNIQSVRCLSSQLAPSHHNISNKVSLLSHLKLKPLRSTPPCLSFQQPCAAKTYDSITRINLGRSEDEVKKCDFIYDPEHPPVLHLKHNIPIQPKKLVLAANLVNRRSIDDALAQAKFSSRRSCYFVHQALLEAHQKAVERGMDPNLLWISESSVKRDSIMKRIQYKGRGRSGTIKSYNCTYRCVLLEGKPPLAKAVRRERKMLHAKERPFKYPKTIKNSLEWY